MNWLRRKIEKPQFELNDYGKLKLDKNRNGFEWSGHIKMPISKSRIELTIEVENKNEPTNEQIRLIQDFENNWQATSNNLFEYMSKCLIDSKWEKDKSDLQKLYSLSAIALKKGNSEWWIVMEPEINVVSIFNFLPRFTIKDDNIIWSNLN